MENEKPSVDEESISQHLKDAPVGSNYSPRAYDLLCSMINKGKMEAYQNQSFKILLVSS
jgi:hypothetical protein